MSYPQWLYAPLCSLAGILVGAIILVVFYEVVWRRETGTKWWWINRERK
jgi:TRAP-type C4-dicarboxylate transport system permease small subunit